MRTALWSIGLVCGLGAFASANPVERAGTLGIALFDGLTPVSPPSGSDSGGWYVIAGADFNGDGHLDVAAIRSNASRLGVILSSPTGYDPAVVVDLCDCFNTTEPSTAIGDTDGDGVLELLVADTNGRRVWAAPFSDGAFGAGRWIPTGDVMPSDFAFEILPDLDADGRDDLVFRQTSPSLAWLVLPSAAPGTVVVRPFQTYLAREWLADLTGDGVPDAVTSAPGLVRVYPGGVGGFGPVSEIPAPEGTASVLDLDGDGAPDLILYDSATGEGWIRRNEGKGVFGPERRFAAPFPFESLQAVGDLNGNGLPDVVVYLKPPGFTSNSRHVWLDPWLGMGPDTPGLVQLRPTRLITSRDLDGDGRPDLVGMDAEQAVALMNRGDASPIIGTHTTAVGVDPLDVRAADFDGDGIPELVVCDFEGFTVWRRGADGSYSGDTLVSDGSVRFMSIPADLNGDGHTDLIVVGANGAEVWAGSDAGLGVGPVIRYEFPEPSFLRQAALGDVTGDGVPDLVAGDIDAGLVRVLTGVAGGWPVPDEPIPLAGARAVALMDVDGDGVADVLASGDAGSVRAFRRGVDGWNGIAEIPMPTRPYWLTAADLDSDGWEDLAVGFDFGSRPVQLVYGGPHGLSEPVPIDPPGPRRGHSEVLIGDVNGDGRPDLVVAPFEPSPTRPMTGVLLQTEPRVFVEGGEIPGIGAGGVTLADANGDGVVDVIGVCNDMATDLLQIHYGRTPPCPADLDGDGAATFFDMTEYLGLFNAGDPAADFAAPFGTLNFYDIAAFIRAFNAGCP